MILRVVKGDNPLQDLTVDGGSFSIGREKDNDYVINDPGISRRHCRFYLEAGQWWIEDLQSVNGVSVNAEKISAKTALRPGDEITAFNHVFIFEPPAEAAPAKGLRVRKLEQLPHDTSAIVAPAALSMDEEQSGLASSEGGGGRLWLAAKLVMLLVILALAGYMALLIFRTSPKKDSGPLELAAVDESPVVVDQGDTTSLLDPGTLDQLEAPVDDTPLFPAFGESRTPSRATRLQPLPQHNADDDDDGNDRPGPLNAAASSNLVLVTSEPSEAEVFLDERPVGTTPLLLRDATAGRHRLILRKDGYEPLTRQIHVPDQLPSRPYQLRLKAGTLLIDSNPSGAWVMQGRRFLGMTPLLLSDLPAGEHEFNLGGPGCEPQKIAARVNPAAGEVVRAELNSQLGGIELNSRPPGCRVYVDGVAMGETVPMPGNPMRAAPFMLSSLIAGPALLKVEHPSGINITGKVTIPPGGVIRQQASLWVPTHRITLMDGTVKIGLLLEENELGDIALEEVGRRSARYLKPEIAEVQRLSNDDISDIIAKSSKGRAEADENETLALARKDDLVISVADILQDRRRLNINDFNATYRDKQIRISGNTSTRYKDNAGAIVVEFGTRAVRCTFERNTPNEDWEIISQAAKNKTPISLRGTCEGIHNGMVMMSNCALALGLQ